MQRSSNSNEAAIALRRTFVLSQPDVAVVSSLFVYPIKSCAGLSRRRLVFDERGPLHDRRWMLVDGAGKFLTQRDHPLLSQVYPKLSEDPDGTTQLSVTTEGLGPLRIPPEPAGRRPVEVWGFQCEALDLGAECADWFSTAIGQSCRLVRFADDVRRPTSQRHTSLKSEVAFSDGYPALLLSVESLIELNRRVDVAVPMNRFRPNIVVRDVRPFEEDSWVKVGSNDITLSVVKPCERCKVTTIDQQSGIGGKEPLKTLARFRRLNGRVVFGQNCVHHGPGWLQVGDRLVVASS